MVVFFFEQSLVQLGSSSCHFLETASWGPAIVGDVRNPIAIVSLMCPKNEVVGELGVVFPAIQKTMRNDVAGTVGGD